MNAAGHAAPPPGATGLSGLTGRIVQPGDDGYETARRSWNGLFSHRPAAIVYVQTARDAVAAVSAARRAGIPLRVRSGGHCLEGWSTVDDGLVVDVSELTAVSIDADDRTATVGAGLTQLQAVAALGAAGFAVPTGTEGSVGLAGATLGGGFGLLTRAFGMACDNLIAAEIVVASGDDGAIPLSVDADHHPELLRVLRGAGNRSFGVVVSLTYAIHPLDRVSTVTAEWAGLDALPEIFEAWQRTAPCADERLTSQLEISRRAVTLFAVLAHGNADEAERMLHPLLSIGSPEVATAHTAWSDAYAAMQVPLDREPANWKFASQFVTEPFSRSAVDIIRRFVSAAPTDECNYFTNAFGGEVPRGEPRGGSAFAHRDALFCAEPGAGWGTRGGMPSSEDPLTETCVRWVADFRAALAPFVNGAYPNVPNADADEWEADYWGPRSPRLRAVKSAYDPMDVFRFPQSIPLGDVVVVSAPGVPPSPGE